jgi:hypothetical protein
MKRWFPTGLVAGLAIAMTAAAGGAAHAQSGRQQDKNNMRNLGVVLGAAAAQQALKGNTTEALVLGAGAAYAGKKYEDARKAQRSDDSWRRGGWIDRDRRDDRYEDRRDDRRYDDSRYDGRYDDVRYRRGDDERVRYHRGNNGRDNGLKLGHYKNGKRNGACR